MSALFRNFSAKLCCLVSPRKSRCQSLVLGKRRDLLAHLQLSHACPVLPGSAALCYCPRLPFPAVYRAEKIRTFLSKCYSIDMLSHLLLIGIRTSLTLGLD